MAVVPLAVEIINQDALLPTLTPLNATSLADGVIFINNGKTFFWLVNDSADTDITLIVDCVNPCNYGFTHDLTELVAFGTQKLIGPFQTARFNDTAGKVTITFTGAPTPGDITVAALHLNV